MIKINKIKLMIKINKIKLMIKINKIKLISFQRFLIAHFEINFSIII